ncbi:hypothetical protein JCM1841_003451 [Sporobolomyces salmonicolor]
MRPVSIPPPRLPPISALLRSIESPQDVEVRSPFLPTPRSSPPSEFKPLVTFSSREAEHAGIAASQSRPVETPHPVPPGQLTSIAFPDGNALHPLPSGLARGLSPMSSPRMSSALYASHPTSIHPPRSTQRRRSITVTTPYLHQPSPALSATHNRRIYPAFATSSERRGSAGEGEGSISGGRSSEADSPSGRQRALSISTTDEYRTLPPIWSSLETQHPFRARDASQQPARDGVDRDDRQSSTVTVGLSSLHITAPQSYRGHYTPSAIPPPPSSASATSQTTASGLRRLSIPTGLSTVAPSSAGSASATTSAGTSASSAASPLLQRAIPPPPQTWPVAPPPSGQSASAPTAAADAMLAADGAVDAAAPNEVGRYACPHCPKRFARPSSLRIHTFSHTGEKPFTCPLCDRAFSVQSNLRRHLKIHKSGIGPVGPSRRGGGTAKASSLGPGASRGGGRTTDGDIDEDADAEGEAEPEDGSSLLGDAAASVDGEALPVPVRASFPDALLR